MRRLLSPSTWVTVLVVVAALLITNYQTFQQDADLRAVSLYDLRLSSWNLARLSMEANAFSRSLSQAGTRNFDSDDLQLHYDILWSRYLHLLHGDESALTRSHGQNLERLTALFDELKGMETTIIGLSESTPAAELTKVTTWWQKQENEIRELVTENFVGGETGRLLDRVERTKDRLVHLRLVTLLALGLIMVYLALTLFVVRRQSRVDPLTGLPNASYLQSLRGDFQGQTVIACEIDDYKHLLNEMGSEVIDRLIREFARRLQQRQRPGDLLVALSGNEFMLLANNQETETEHRLQELVTDTTFEWHVGDLVFLIRGRFGAAPPARASERWSWREHYQHALRAMTHAQREGLPFAINSQALLAKIQADRVILKGLSDLFRDQPSSLQLSLVYQPIVSASDIHEVRGTEVLLRATDCQIGAIAPNDLVTLCERNGLGHELGCWVFDQVARETARLPASFWRNGSLAINLNPAMLTESLIDDVEERLIANGIPGSAICLEITEDNAATRFPALNGLLDRLRQLGVSLALDDFGTGHSSLEHIRKLQVDRLKIDRCFVEGIDESPNQARFLGSIIAMARELDVENVIEGVETRAQWEQVNRLGGELVQGYFAHQPLSIDTLCELLESRPPTVSACQPSSPAN